MLYVFVKDRHEMQIAMITEVVRHVYVSNHLIIIIEPRHEKTCIRGFRPGKTQTGLQSHKS